MILFVVAMLVAALLCSLFITIEMLLSNEGEVCISIRNTRAVFFLSCLIVISFACAVVYAAQLGDYVRTQRALCEEELPRNQECEFNGMIFRVVEQ